MEIAEHIAAVRAQGDLMAASVPDADLDSRVPSCPDWDLRELVRHLGGVHRWAAVIVGEPKKEPWEVDLPEVVGEWPADADLIPWFRDGLDLLVTALTNADPAEQFWSFLPAPSPLAMWARRQAYETTVHRADAELAAARDVTPLAADLAADGIDELLVGFVSRRKLRSEQPTRLAIGCTDTAAAWTLHIHPEQVDVTDGLDGDTVVRGPASDLYFALWHRQSTEALTIDGDPAVFDLFNDRVRVRW